MAKQSDLEPIELTVQVVGGNDTDPGDIDRMTRSLRSELEKLLYLENARLGMSCLVY
jgi:hypothetical protein